MSAQMQKIKKEIEDRFLQDLQTGDFVHLQKWNMRARKNQTVKTALIECLKEHADQKRFHPKGFWRKLRLKIRGEKILIPEEQRLIADVMLEQLDLTQSRFTSNRKAIFERYLQIKKEHFLARKQKTRYAALLRFFESARRDDGVHHEVKTTEDEGQTLPQTFTTEMLKDLGQFELNVLRDKTLKFHDFLLKENQSKGLHDYFVLAFKSDGLDRKYKTPFENALECMLKDEAVPFEPEFMRFCKADAGLARKLFDVILKTDRVDVLLPYVSDHPLSILPYQEAIENMVWRVISKAIHAQMPIPEDANKITLTQPLKDSLSVIETLKVPFFKLVKKSITEKNDHVLRFLLENAENRLSSNDKMKLFMYALTENNITLLKLLIQTRQLYTGDVSSEANKYKNVQAYLKTITVEDPRFHHIPALAYAAMVASREALTVLLEESPLRYEASGKLDALSTAVVEEKIDNIEVLLEQYPDPDLNMDIHGRMPIYYSVILNFPEITKRLIQAGANIDHQWTATDSSKNSLCYLAVRKVHLETVKVLLDHQIDLTKESPWTSMHGGLTNDPLDKIDLKKEILNELLFHKHGYLSLYQKYHQAKKEIRARVSNPPRMLEDSIVYAIQSGHQTILNASCEMFQQFRDAHGRLLLDVVYIEEQLTAKKIHMTPESSKFLYALGGVTQHSAEENALLNRLQRLQQSASVYDEFVEKAAEQTVLKLKERYKRLSKEQLKAAHHDMQAFFKAHSSTKIQQGFSRTQHDVYQQYNISLYDMTILIWVALHDQECLKPNVKKHLETLSDAERTAFLSSVMADTLKDAQTANGPNSPCCTHGMFTRLCTCVQHVSNDLKTADDFVLDSFGVSKNEETIDKVQKLHLLLSKQIGPKVWSELSLSLKQDIYQHWKVMIVDEKARLKHHDRYANPTFQTIRMLFKKELIDNYKTYFGQNSISPSKVELLAIDKFLLESETYLFPNYYLELFQFTTDVFLNTSIEKNVKTEILSILYRVQEYLVLCGQKDSVYDETLTSDYFMAAAKKIEHAMKAITGDGARSELEAMTQFLKCCAQLPISKERIAEFLSHSNAKREDVLAAANQSHPSLPQFTDLYNGDLTENMSSKEKDEAFAKALTQVHPASALQEIQTKVKRNQMKKPKNMLMSKDASLDGPPAAEVKKPNRSRRLSLK